MGLDLKKRGLDMKKNDGKKCHIDRGRRIENAIEKSRNMKMGGKYLKK